MALTPGAWPLQKCLAQEAPAVGSVAAGRSLYGGLTGAVPALRKQFLVFGRFFCAETLFGSPPAPGISDRQFCSSSADFARPSSSSGLPCPMRRWRGTVAMNSSSAAVALCLWTGSGVSSVIEVACHGVTVANCSCGTPYCRAPASARPPPPPPPILLPPLLSLPCPPPPTPSPPPTPPPPPPSPSPPSPPLPLPPSLLTPPVPYPPNFPPIPPSSAHNPPPRRSWPRRSLLPLLPLRLDVACSRSVPAHESTDVASSAQGPAPSPRVTGDRVNPRKLIRGLGVGTAAQLHPARTRPGYCDSTLSDPDPGPSRSPVLPPYPHPPHDKAQPKPATTHPNDLSALPPFNSLHVRCLPLPTRHPPSSSCPDTARKPNPNSRAPPDRPMTFQASPVPSEKPERAASS